MALSEQFWQQKSLLEMSDEEWKHYVTVAVNAVIESLLKEEVNGNGSILPVLLAICWI